MKLYNTVEGYGEAEQTIEKSRFICSVNRVSSREEAEEFISSVKRKYKDATHNVPAMVIGDKMQMQWASDDGEPQGTAGAPVIQLLVSMEVTNVAVVITRYFGGIKLGTGGLVRAYTSTAKLGLEVCGIHEVYEKSVIEYELDYSSYSKLESLKEKCFEINNTIYGETVRTELSFDPENEERVRLLLGTVTSGRGRIVSCTSRIL